jgi:uncharacterized pyridoxamine 5'-phosphate oxidase family protein
MFVPLKRHSTIYLISAYNKSIVLCLTDYKDIRIYSFQLSLAVIIFAPNNAFSKIVNFQMLIFKHLWNLMYDYSAIKYLARSKFRFT